MLFSPFFGSALARGGGGLYSMCLSSHHDMMVAFAPNIEFFRSFRNAMIRDIGDPALLAACPPAAPLQDWYGSEERIAILDHLLDSASLDLSFDKDQWESFLDISVRRGELETADLATHYESLKGRTYKEIMTNLLDIIGGTRDSQERKWVGLHEPWIVDYFPVLARAFPEARFLIVLRDPRAVVNSMIEFKNIDPSQEAQVLSYVRHWRKYAALAVRLARDPKFAGRLHVTAYELIIANSERALTDICRAFDLEFDSGMLDTNNFHNYASGATWTGNSSFENKIQGFSSQRAFHWKEKLDLSALNSVEYLCGPDLRMIGYPTVTEFSNPSKAADGDVADFLLADHSRDASWRSDLNDPLLDLGLEAVRRQLLLLSTPSKDYSLIRRNFLFNETYNILRNEESPLLPALTEKLEC